MFKKLRKKYLATATIFGLTNRTHTRAGSRLSGYQVDFCAWLR